MLRLALMLLATGPVLARAQSPDLIVTASHIWTGDSTRPRAAALAVIGDRIVAVGTRQEILRLRGSGTRVLEMGSRFIAPGFIDNHTHFERAGALITGVNLLDVSDNAGLVRRVREARDRLPAGAWLVGGEWGAYEEWAMGSTGASADARRTAFAPHRAVIDSLTPATPAILNKWDRTAYLANGRALALARADCDLAGCRMRAGGAHGPH